MRIEPTAVGRRVAHPHEVRILIIDDSAAVRARLVDHLSDAGLQVAGQAGTATAGLSLARSLLPDAIILDLELPDRHGLEVLPELKAQARAPIVAIVTNHSESAYRQRCFALGADYFFDKSTQLDELVAALGK